MIRPEGFALPVLGGLGLAVIGALATGCTSPQVGHAWQPKRLPFEGEEVARSGGTGDLRFVSQPAPRWSSFTIPTGRPAPATGYTADVLTQRLGGRARRSGSGATPAERWIGCDPQLGVQTWVHGGLYERWRVCDADPEVGGWVPDPTWLYPRPPCSLEIGGPWLGELLNLLLERTLPEHILNELPSGPRAPALALDYDREFEIYLVGLTWGPW